MSGDPSYNLICAVRNGNVQAAKELIDTYGISYSNAWSSGYNLLREALKNKHEKMTKLLLKSGSKVNSKNKRPTETPLHFAARNGYTEIVSMLLDRGANIHARNQFYDTPLHCAADQGCLEVVKILINRNACVDTKSKFGKTALHYAVIAGHLDIVDELLNRGAHLHVFCTDSSNYGYTPLHCAAMEGNEAMIKLLLSKGAKINTPTEDKIMPIHIATDMKRDNIVKLLLEEGANVNARDKNGKTVLHFAVERGFLTTIEHILHFRPDLNSEANRNSLYAAVRCRVGNESAKIVDALLRYGFAVRRDDVQDAKLLHAAVEQGYLEIVEALLKLGADVNTLHSTKRGCTLLHSAVIHRQFGITQLLLSHGANVNAKDEMRKPAICYAIECNDARITKLLLNASASVKVTTELLHIAVKKENPEIVEILLKVAPNFDINAYDKHGRTALHHTALNEGWDYSTGLYANEKLTNARSEMAKMFLSRGARVNAVTKNGTTALHAAAEGGYTKVVEVLLENKANVNALAEHRATPLHFAAKTNYVTIVKMLLDSGANVNARQTSGMTALHIATQNGNHAVVELLVERGADLDARDNKNKSSALHFAIIGGCPDIVDTLLKLGANVDTKDKLERTALHVAAKHGWPLVAECLLDHGADVNATCKYSMTPLDYANLGTSNYANMHDHSPFDDYFDQYSDVFNDPEYDAWYDYYADEYDSVSDCPCEEVAAVLEQHIIMMKALDLYVSDKNLRVTDLHFEHRETLEDCQLQIANMKSQKIGDSNVSFYDVLTRSINQLAIYARNESIVRVLESEEFNCEFPSYFRMLLRRFKQGQKRESMLSSSLKSLGALIGYVLPDLSVMEVFNYLSNQDLENLIKAYPNADHCDS